MTFEKFADILTVISGILMFFMGLNMLSEGALSIFNNNKRFDLSVKRYGLWRFYLIGVAITAVIQSSDATTIIGLNLLDKEIIDKKKCLALSFGARLGTCMTALIFSLAGLKISPLILSLSLFFCIILKRDNVKKALLGLALCFGGLSIMEWGVRGLFDIISVILTKTDNYFLLFLAGIGITAIIQSSSSVSGILVLLTSLNVIDLDRAIFILIGAYIGTTVTPLIVSLRITKKASVVSLTNMLCSFILGTISFILVNIYIKDILLLLSNITLSFRLSLFGVLYSALSSIVCFLGLRLTSAIGQIIVIRPKNAI